MSHIAKELGINDNTLYNWVGVYKRKYNINDTAAHKEPLSEQEELKKLRKENARLKMECDILKKATAYFAKETL